MGAGQNSQFQRWFGDWETLAVINEIKDMSAKPVKLHEALDKAGIKEAFKNFGEVANERDGRKVVFPSASAGKIRRHKGFDSNTIIKHFKSLFKASIPILSEKEEIKEGHKAHGNIESVEHYVNKFSVNGSEYYIRFTVPIIRNDRSAGNVHSSAISEVSIYKNGDSTLYPLNTAGSSSPSFIDRKLSDFLNSVKPENVSKVVDENGEPVAVYHGTPKFDRFSIFKKGSGGYLGPAIYFTNLKTYAQKYENKWGEGGNLYDVFLSLRNPLVVKSINPAKEILKTIYGKDSVYDRRSQKQSYDTKILSSADIKKLQSKGYDGVIWEYGGSKEYAVYDSSKIKSATDNIGTYSENPDIRWREVSEPSPEEIAEANRQKADVKAKWSNPDGSMKKGYMLAPNGKHTNLTEDQWLQVRTPNFKKWFGDWEKEAWAKAAMDFLERTAPVANLTGHEFQKDGVRLTDKVSAYFNSIGNVAHNEELGDVILNLEGIKDSIAHGIGRLKASAFMAVKDVIENGFIFNRETNWKNRNYDSAVIVAPISINNTDYICEAVITRRPNENRFYLHEVEIKETLEKAFKTPTEGRASQASKLIIGKHLAEVKGNVSKVVDENGEPMVVYHGSTAMFNEFRSKFIGHSTGTADGRGFYFTTDKSYARDLNRKMEE